MLCFCHAVTILLPWYNVKKCMLVGGAGSQRYVVVLQLEVNGKKKTIHRKYKELLWLHRNLLRRVELGGNIVSCQNYGRDP